MEEKILIQNLKIYPAATTEQVKALVEELAKNDTPELLLFPHAEKEYYFEGIMLEKYYTPALADTATVRNNMAEGDFRVFLISRTALRAFIQHLARKMQPTAPQKGVSEFKFNDFPFDPILDDTDDTTLTEPKPAEQDPILHFLKTQSPAAIQKELDAQVIGQRALTKAVADFLYYHALRQRHPDLPQRPLLIAGPSGSGKTEVWRVASKLYGPVFQIKIVDGSNLSCDGWAGNYKLSTFVTPQFANGGILVVDEFDKLAKPKYTSGGENVALQMQAEFLKLFEGEHHVTENKRQTNVTSKLMGFVLVGAFEGLRDQKDNPSNTKVSPIGFCASPSASQKEAQKGNYNFTDEDFIAYGIMSEIVGRIAAKCATNPLDENAYLSIILSAHSRVAKIEQVLKLYGIQVSDVVSEDELKSMIAQSQTNRTGVRWVSAQVENRLLEAIREQGLFPGGQTPTPSVRKCA